MSIQMFNSIISEGLEQGDLKRLLHPKIHIDEFTSKMGDDADILVVSFKLSDKNPAKDLMSFIERGYDWVLDADISTGELDDGEYLVFVEMERSPVAAQQITELIEDVVNLSDQTINDWKFQYQKSKLEYPITSENIRKIVPLTADEYIKKYNKNDDINALKESARVKITSKAPINSFTENLRVISGIK